MAWCLRNYNIYRTGRHLRNCCKISAARRRDVSTLSARPSCSRHLVGPPQTSLNLGISRTELVGTYSTGSSHEVSYSEMVELARDETNLIIDVREPSERTFFGYIGSASINIPLGELYQAFSLPDEDFEDRYNFVKPGKDSSKVILHCMSGVRSALARDIVRSTGYTKVRDYPGGWNEWAEKDNR